jgi:hypothetical protein
MAEQGHRRWPVGVQWVNAKRWLARDWDRPSVPTSTKSFAHLYAIGALKGDLPFAEGLGKNRFL